MAETPAEIPNRAVFRAAEVCEIARVQPYVLRSWELEFPDLGVAKTAGGARVYRRADVERVLRIKQLVFEQGLTLAGARRRIEEERQSQQQTVETPELLDDGVRQRLTKVRDGLKGLLSMLGSEMSSARDDVTGLEAAPPPGAVVGEDAVGAQAGGVDPATEAPSAPASKRGRKRRPQQEAGTLPNGEPDEER